MEMVENSQHWLSRAAIRIAEEVLEPNGYGNLAGTDRPILDNIVVSTGLPTSRAFNARGRNIGQCFDPQYSANGEAQIFISPTVTDSEEVLGVLVHEMLHAACGQKAGHGPKFEAACHAVGLEGPAASTVVGGELSVQLAEIAADLGEYPHPRLDITIIPKQTTRLLKVKCINQNCPYFYNYGKPCVLRATWHAVKDATPICGHCSERMAVQMPKSQQSGGGGGGEGGEEPERDEDDEFRVIDPNQNGGGEGEGESGEGEPGEGEGGGGGESGDGEMTDAELAQLEAEAAEALAEAGYGDVEATEEGEDGTGQGKVGRKQSASDGDGGTGKVKLGVGRVKQKPAHPVEMDCDCANCVRGREAAGL